LKTQQVVLTIMIDQISVKQEAKESERESADTEHSSSLSETFVDR
jgi:hypothetical protein